jgi:hypothetical protein
MKSISKHAVVAIACLAAAMAVAGGASAADKVQICHGTASATNPYVVISVGKSARAGHPDGEAAHGWKNHPDLVYVGGQCVAVGDGGGSDDGQDGDGGTGGDGGGTGGEGGGSGQD